MPFLLVVLTVVVSFASPRAAHAYLQATSGVEVVASYSPFTDSWELTVETDTTIGTGFFNVVGASTFVPRPQACNQVDLLCVTFPSSNGLHVALLAYGALTPNVGNAVVIGTVDSVSDLDLTGVLVFFGQEGFADPQFAVIPWTLVVAGPRPPFRVDDEADGADALPGDGLCRAVSGSCTLRAAVMEANGLVGFDVIDVPAGSYSLTLSGANEDLSATGDLDIHHELEIRGAGAGATTIAAGGVGDRVLEVHSSAAAALFDLTLSGGFLSGAQSHGGGIRNTGSLALTRSGLIGNEADLGGAISNSGQLSLTASTLEGNRASGGGGAIWNHGTLAVTGSTLEENVSTLGDGGAIANQGGSVTIASSTLRGNSAVAGGAVRNALDGQVSIDRSLLEDNDASLGGALANPLGIVSLSETTLRFNEAAEGGAILNLDALSIDGTTISENGRLGQTVGGGIRNSGTLVAVNSTVSGNMAGGLGAGVATDGGRALLSYCTITANRGAGSATGGLWSSGPVVLRGTVVAGNHNGPEVPSDCFDGASSVTSRGHNLVGNGNDCPNVAASTDQVGSFASPLDPGLDALRFNGGPTPTHALLPGSPAIDVIPAADCTYDHDGTPASPEQALLLDQRHVQRPRGLGCDIGAYEISGEFVQCVADLNQCKRAVINGNGDVNADGQVDGLDSDLLRRILAGLAAE